MTPLGGGHEAHISLFAAVFVATAIDRKAASTTLYFHLETLRPRQRRVMTPRSWQ